MTPTPNPAITSDTAERLAAAVNNNLGPQPEPEIPPLGVEEIQQLREILSRSADDTAPKFRLEPKPITDTDKDAYWECVNKGIPYSEVHIMMNGKLKITFREKTKRECDIASGLLASDFENRRIRSNHDIVTQINNYNMVLQMVALNDVPQPSLLPPPGMPLPPDFDKTFRAQMERHLISSMPEMKMMILIAALESFQIRVRIMAQDIIKENFPTPVGVS